MPGIVCEVGGWEGGGMGTSGGWRSSKGEEEEEEEEGCGRKKK